LNLNRIFKDKVPGNIKIKNGFFPDYEKEGCRELKIIYNINLQ